MNEEIKQIKNRYKNITIEKINNKNDAIVSDFYLIMLVFVMSGLMNKGNLTIIILTSIMLYFVFCLIGSKLFKENENKEIWTIKVNVNETLNRRIAK